MKNYSCSKPNKLTKHMKICLISKYPPIEGGVSSRTYWLARALGSKGHEVHVVSNAWEVESSYRENIQTEDLKFAYKLKNVYIHATDLSIEPTFIPYSKLYTEKIASLAIDIIQKYNLQIIDSWYILPYVISGFLAKIITNKPLIMRHAGSDIHRLFSLPYLQPLLISIFKKVDKIVTYPTRKEMFLKLGISESKLFYNTKVSVDTSFFHPGVRPIDLSNYTKKDIDNAPIITYIGKAEITKGIYELIEGASRIKDDFFLLFVSKGKGLLQFQKFVKKRGLERKTIFVDFLPPWKIPAVIKRSTCVVVLEHDFPIKQHSPILPREVMAVGKCLILSEEIYNKGIYQTACNERCLIVVNPKDIQQLKEKLENIIRKPSYAEEIGQNAFKFSKKIERFDEYIDDNISLYEQIITKHNNSTMLMPKATICMNH